MGETKPTASLSGLLLARKGAARPAMRRPSTFDRLGNNAVAVEDLGWNDMGYDVDPDPNTPMDHEHDLGYNPLAGAVPEAKAEVRHQQERIAEQLQVQAEAGFDSVPAMKPDEMVPDAKVTKINPLAKKPSTISTIGKAELAVVNAHPKKRAAPGSKGKAAFTLRLDQERHLKLRLACTLNNLSAQMLVTDALDAFLQDVPGLDELVSRIPARKAGK